MRIDMLYYMFVYCVWDHHRVEPLAHTVCLAWDLHQAELRSSPGLHLGIFNNPYLISLLLGQIFISPPSRQARTPPTKAPPRAHTRTRHPANKPLPTIITYVLGIKA